MNAFPNEATVVDRYWSQHMVCSKCFQSAQESEDYLGWRFRVYPLFREFSGLYGDHKGEVVLDYGCGPGNDLVGFALFSRARKIIGMDVSSTALRLAEERLSLHQVLKDRVELVPMSDAAPTLDLPDNCIDFISCQGVLQHISHPDRILQEFYRVLKPTGRAVIMVYNRNSIWFHLYTAYEKLIVEGVFSGADANTAFSMNVDGETCPAARCYENEEFELICRRAGFDVSYAGGYLSETELQAIDRSFTQAQSDVRLAEIHSNFLKALTFDANKFPLYRGYHAGIGGVYKLFTWNKVAERDRTGIRSIVERVERADASAQEAQIRSYYFRIERQLAELEGQHAVLLKENEQLRNWQSRVLSMPGVSLVVALRLWFLRVWRNGVISHRDK